MWSEVPVAGRLHHPGSLVGGGVEGFSGGLRPPGNKLLISGAAPAQQGRVVEGEGEQPPVQNPENMRHKSERSLRS